MLGEDRLRVELHPGKRVLTMAQPHHDAVIRPGGDLEVGWQAVALDHRRVMAGGGEGARGATKDGLLLVEHPRVRTVHELVRVSHWTAVGFTETLAAPTDDERWKRWPQLQREM